MNINKTANNLKKLSKDLDRPISPCYHINKINRIFDCIIHHRDGTPPAERKKGELLMDLNSTNNLNKIFSPIEINLDNSPFVFSGNLFQNKENFNSNNLAERKELKKDETQIVEFPKNKDVGSNTINDLKNRKEKGTQNVSKSFRKRAKTRW